MDIKITIKNYDDFDTAFKKVLDQDFKTWLQSYLTDMYIVGKQKIAEENSTPTIIEKMVKVD